MKERENLLDKRVALNNIREGLLEKKEYEKFLNSLPDASDKAVEVSIEDIAPKSYLKSVRGAETSETVDTESEKETQS